MAIWTRRSRTSSDSFDGGEPTVVSHFLADSLAIGGGRFWISVTLKSVWRVGDVWVSQSLY